MRVRARKIDIAMVPAEILPLLGRDLAQNFVTPGVEYEVHALVSSDGVVLAQIVNDVNWPDWSPVWAFDVIDQTIPDDWMCSVFKDGSWLVLGPAFIAASVEDYDAMVELEADKQTLFWRRINSTSGAPKTETDR